MFSPILLFPLIFLFSISNVSSRFHSLALLPKKTDDSSQMLDFHPLRAHKTIEPEEEEEEEEEEKQFPVGSAEVGEEFESKVSEMKDIKISKEYEMELSKSLDKCDMGPLRKPIMSLNAYQIAALSIDGIQELISEALRKIGIDVDNGSVECASKAVANYKKVIMAKYELSEKREQKHSRRNIKKMF